MTVNLDLSEETLERLASEATRRGISLDELVSELAAGLAADVRGDDASVPSFVAIGSSTSGRAARDADAMLEEGFGS